MISMYKTQHDRLELMQSFETGTWINVENPTLEEMDYLSKTFGIAPEDLKAGLDEEERAHINTEDDYTVIIVDVPIKDEEGVHEYVTIPMEIVISEHFIMTICLRRVEMIQDFITGKVKTFYTFKKTRFILQLLYKNASYYLQYLRYIDKASNKVEQELNKAMRNKELIQLLELEKSLVYFTTSLRANEIVFEKMMRMEKIKQYPEDKDLLEDLIIENKQAMEMANIYSSILSETRDAFASVISNNLNIVMKTLTSLTIVLSIPTMIFSLFGMNVPLPFMHDPAGLVYILFGCFILIIIGVIIMFRKKMF
ncbi:magnesium transporter CorA family protein [Niameybacter massiliensis]|uniref:Magnesium transporter CorA family protein n=1 Tax=Holtiella tumoricola TaxID=3018743 RepID=A0AA42DQM5_9FIRM|nr:MULTISPECIES: magnesium transporter CorA family protein [Lachnospirales]MDA3733390.1 magnesium transporter CorA family protein [Holtiella tumoricola]